MSVARATACTANSYRLYSYQVEALADIKKTLAEHDKATAVMACGTGKTLLALWAAEQEMPQTVLVLVPSLTLLQQTLLEWSKQTKWGSSFSYLCVCSDPTVGLKNDDLNIDKAEVGFRIDSDPTIVRQFLERQTTDIKVVFSTYHSSPISGMVRVDCRRLMSVSLMRRTRRLVLQAVHSVTPCRMRTFA